MIAIGHLYSSFPLDSCIQIRRSMVTRLLTTGLRDVFWWATVSNPTIQDLVITVPDICKPMTVITLIQYFDITITTAGILLYSLWLPEIRSNYLNFRSKPADTLTVLNSSKSGYDDRYYVQFSQIYRLSKGDDPIIYQHFRLDYR